MRNRDPLQTVRRMSNHTSNHNHETCPGCDHIHDIDALVVVLDQPKQTLYKRSRLTGMGMFPKRLTDRTRIAVRCCDAKSYLEAVAK